MAELALSIDLAVKAARKAGFLIVHAPANCMEFYEGTEMRNRAREAPLATPPIQLTTTERFGTTWCWPDDSEPPLPIDDSDGGCDCDAGSTPVDACVWTRQADTIAIEASDAITESAQELYNLLVHRGVKRVLICGVHLNMCVLGRGYGIRQLVRLGFTVRLISDLTDTMYSGASRSPYVSHFRGTELVINHVERHWCASILSTDVTGRPPFRFRGAEVALQADGLWPAADSSSLAADPSTSSPAGRGGTCSCACDRSERHGWSIVAIAFLVDALALGGRGIFSVALLYFEAEWAWERNTASALKSLVHVCIAISTIVAGQLADTCPPLLSLGGGILFLALCYALVAAMQSTWQAWLFYGVMTGCGWGALNLNVFSVAVVSGLTDVGSNASASAYERRSCAIPCPPLTADKRRR